MDLQLALNKFGTDVFRRQADCDYIAARANFRMQLRQQFLWSSQQALEKYLKAILLFNGMSARFIVGDPARPKEYGHNLDALVKDVKTIPIFKFELEDADEKFLEYLAKQGPNRYLRTTAYNTGEGLRRLDSTVWHVRRYCQYMPDLPDLPGLREAHVKAALSSDHKKFPQRFHLFSGELEKVVNRPPTDPARRALLWANLYYGLKRRTRVRYKTFSSSEVPPQECGWEDVDWSEIEKFIKL